MFERRSNAQATPTLSRSFRESAVRRNSKRLHNGERAKEIEGPNKRAAGSRGTIEFSSRAQKPKFSARGFITPGQDIKLWVTRLRASACARVLAQNSSDRAGPPGSRSRRPGTFFLSLCGRAARHHELADLNDRRMLVRATLLSSCLPRFVPLRSSAELRFSFLCRAADTLHADV